MDDPIKYEIVGVGFGPANLALCVALNDARFRSPGIFFESQAAFSWHAGMQMDGSTMQTPFLEDLITRQNPTSEFTFLNYLKEQGRLTDFADLREFYPTRYEFNDYFRWAANKVAPWVRYGAQVTTISPVLSEDSSVHALDISIQDTQSGREQVVRTRNAVLGLGYAPIVPKMSGPLKTGGRVFHSTTTLPSLQARFSSHEAPYTFLVAGAGQSAAEITHYLLRTYRNARVTVISRGFVFRAKDGNAFVSSFYTGDAADQFYELGDDSRRLLLTTLDDSNYAAADSDLLRDLAKLTYSDRTEGRRRLELRSFTEIRDIDEADSTVAISCWNELYGRAEKIEADGVCLATGFSDASLKYVLKNVDEYLKQTVTGDYHVNREYRLETKPTFRPGIYVQGYAKHYHGCTEGTISDLPHRAHRILDSLTHRRFERKAGQFIRPAVATGTGS
jgi:L-ornithine N5-oxygenase